MVAVKHCYYEKEKGSEILRGVRISLGQVGISVEDQVMTAPVPEGFQFVQNFACGRTQIALALPAVMSIKVC